MGSEIGSHSDPSASSISAPILWRGSETERDAGSVTLCVYVCVVGVCVCVCVCVWVFCVVSILTSGLSFDMPCFG
jgi:hypothetical protein